jgi:adenylosuccinate synthase
MKPLCANHYINNNHNNRKQIAEHTAVVIQGRAQRAAERSAEKKKAYDDWSHQKQLLEAARSALQHIDPPTVAVVTSSNGHSNAFLASTGGSAGSGRQEAAARELWIEVCMRSNINFYYSYYSAGGVSFDGAKLTVLVV